MTSSPAKSPGGYPMSSLAMAEAEPAKLRWVISFLVIGDEEGMLAIDAEHRMKSAFWEHPEGAELITSTLARFRDLSPAEQDRWESILQREAGDFL